MGKATLLVIPLSGRVTQARLVYIAVKIMFPSASIQPGYFFPVALLNIHPPVTPPRAEDKVNIC